MQEFHEFLKNCRLEKGLTIDEVSNALDINRSVLYQYEANKTFPNGKNLIKLARFYHFSLDDFFEIVDHQDHRVPTYNVLGESIYCEDLMPQKNTAYYVLNSHQAVLVATTHHYYVGKEVLAFYKQKATIFKILKEKNQLFLLSYQGELIDFKSKELQIIGIILQWISF